MKLLFLSLLVSISTFSQEYHFDYFISENKKREKQEWISQMFINSATQQALYLRVENNKIVASLYNEAHNTQHLFKVDKKGEKYSFIYSHSKQFLPQTSSKEFAKENVIKVEKIDSLNFNVNVFKNSKLKNKILSAQVTVEPSDFNYIKFFADYTRTDEIDEKIKAYLNPNQKYKIKYERLTKPNNNLGQTVVWNMDVNAEKVELKVVVPEKLIIKDATYNDFQN